MNTDSNNIAAIYMEEEMDGQIEERAEKYANAFSWEGLDKSCAALKKLHLKKWLKDVVLQNAGMEAEMKSYLEMHARELKDAEEWAMSLFDLEDMDILSTLYRVEKQMEMIREVIYKNKVMKRLSELPHDAYHFENQTNGRRWYMNDGGNIKNIMVQDGHWSKEAQKGEITLSIYEKDLYDKAVEHVNKLRP